MPAHSEGPAMAPSHTHCDIDMLALAKLLQLVSPALPVGAYAYSEAMEYAVDARWITDEAQARDWIIGRLEHNMALVDVPVLARLWRAFCHPDLADPAGGHAAASDHAAASNRAAEHWSRILWALRESAELRTADGDMGRSLARLLVSLGVADAEPWIRHPHTTYPTLFALAAAHWRIALAPTASGYLYAWSESQVAAAIKLVPLGQAAGQRILSAAIDCIPAAVEYALSLADEDIGAGAPGLAIFSSLHETMYARLFRS